MLDLPKNKVFLDVYTSVFKFCWIFFSDFSHFFPLVSAYRFAKMFW